MWFGAWRQAVDRAESIQELCPGCFQRILIFFCIFMTTVMPPRLRYGSLRVRDDRHARDSVISLLRDRRTGRVSSFSTWPKLLPSSGPRCGSYGPFSLVMSLLNIVFFSKLFQMIRRSWIQESGEERYHNHAWNQQFNLLDSGTVLYHDQLLPVLHVESERLRL